MLKLRGFQLSDFFMAIACGSFEPIQLSAISYQLFRKLKVFFGIADS